MPLRTECPRCPTPLAASVDEAGRDGWSCPEHGPTAALRRPDEASYAGFAEALSVAGELPTYLPGR